MCVFHDNVLSRWIPKNTGVDVLSSLVPFQVTFSLRVVDSACSMLSWFLALM